jgi:formylglycine-generating enzyme required for sulfatase activity
MARIFISYRRDDSGGWAGRLYDRLSQRFGRDNVFMDIDTIEPGLDFVQVIEKAVASCNALIAVIGRQWLTITDETGRRRLDHPEDFVRLEIAAALARNIRVIPALIEGARMPRSTDLPDGLQLLARRNAHEVSDRRFHYDVDRLIAVLDAVLAPVKPATDGRQDVGGTNTERPPPPPYESSSASSLPLEPEMILIPAGVFLMGSDEKAAANDERPQHRLSLPVYYLAKIPVTNAQYCAFVQATDYNAPKGWVGTSPPRGEADHPVVHVSCHDGLAYCRWLSAVTGKTYSLTSEAEWEKGARGTDGRTYPWGSRWSAKRCNAAEGDQAATTPVGAYPRGVSPYGLLDMAGNVWEWTRSLWGNYPYPRTAKGRERREDLQAPDDQARVLRGGTFLSNRWVVRCAYRHAGLPDARHGDIGFRVVMRPSS